MKILAATGMCLLLLGLAACEDSATGLTGSDLCGFTGSCGVSLPSGMDTIFINTTSLPDATVNVAYSQALSAYCICGPTWSVTVGSLPTGLSLEDVGFYEANITGTPTVVGTSSFTVQISNGDGRSATKRLGIRVNP